MTREEVAELFEAKGDDLLYFAREHGNDEEFPADVRYAFGRLIEAAEEVERLLGLDD